MTKTAEQRAESQQWAEKVQESETKLSEVSEACQKYLDGLTTGGEALHEIIFLLRDRLQG